ncbi:hypothetical protein FS837_002356 [Tulasnella sp. UAMH 9824]|nr:hypothetical protein FS837_002356 [Tulasnella sp. UAMH 9824]
MINSRPPSLLRSFLFMYCWIALVQAAPFAAILQDISMAATSARSTSAVATSAPQSASPMIIVPAAGTSFPGNTSQEPTSTLEIGGGSTTIDQTIITTSTVTITSPSQTITVHANPTTKTEIISVIESLASSLVPEPTKKPKPPPASTTTWNAPSKFTNLGAFKVRKFAYGQNNIQLVDVSRDGTSGSSVDPSDSPTGDVETGIQAFFPKGSINPGKRPDGAPQGGADFYAAPLDISRSNNVSMSYSVFFPKNFDFVLGGKLPGLYGGRPGCSGGDAAEDCFSTRLMWRKGGAGELYLYAPKSKQGEGVCDTPPKSDCNVDYGLSIGRGSFKFTPGRWTNVQQTVVLNTPGKQDGTFVLEVDGQRVLDVQGLYYREGHPLSVSSLPLGGLAQKPVKYLKAGGGEILARRGDRITADSPAADATGPTKEGSILAAAAVDGLLGSLAVDLSPLMDDDASIPEEADQRKAKIEDDPYEGDIDDPLVGDFEDELNVEPLKRTGVFADGIGRTSLGTTARRRKGMKNKVEVVFDTVTAASAVRTVLLPPLLPDVTRTVVLPSASAGAISDGLRAMGSQKGDDASNDDPVGFVGIFFSTFFGGHESKFATPVDQKLWFGDLALRINDGDS